MWRVTTCCCCLSLEAGAKLIAWIQLILGFVSSIIIGVQSSHLKQEDKNAYTTGMIVDSVISALLGLVLLLGVTKKGTTLVYSWILVSSVIAVLSAVFLVIGLAMTATPVILITQLVPFGLSVYFIIVVYSYYKEEQLTVSLT